MTMSKSTITPQHDAQTDFGACWAEQERLRKAIATGMAVPAVDRALFDALACEDVPSLPEGFAATVANTAERLADARHCIARFRALSLRLFGLVYLPAITAVVVLFAGDLPAMWARLAPEQRTPMLWAATLALLWSIIAITERLRLRDRSLLAPP